MARDKANQQNIDGSDLPNYPNKRIRNNDGTGNGTPVNEQVYGDIHEYFAKTMREAGISYNDLPDNVTNGYQYYKASFELANKNNFLKEITLTAPDTLSIPNRLGALKAAEVIEFKTDFNWNPQIIFIKGEDNLIKNLNILGQWKAGDTVRIVNYQNNCTIVGLYNSQNVPNLSTTISNILTKFTLWDKIMEVFKPGFGMVLFNRPANEIPPGWAEVVEFKGRLPIGFNDAVSEFNQMGKTGGDKKVKILKTNLPGVGLKLYPGRSTSADWRTTSGSGAPLLDIFPSPQSNQFVSSFERETAPMGDGTDLNILNPYRVVLFIEFIG